MKTHDRRAIRPGGPLAVAYPPSFEDQYKPLLSPAAWELYHYYHWHAAMIEVEQETIIEIRKRFHLAGWTLADLHDELASWGLLEVRPGRQDGRIRVFDPRPLSDGLVAWQRRYVAALDAADAGLAEEEEEVQGCLGGITGMLQVGQGLEKKLDTFSVVYSTSTKLRTREELVTENVSNFQRSDGGPDIWVTPDGETTEPPLQPVRKGTSALRERLTIADLIVAGREARPVSRRVRRYDEQHEPVGRGSATPRTKLSVRALLWDYFCARHLFHQHVPYRGSRKENLHLCAMYHWLRKELGLSELDGINVALAAIDVYFTAMPQNVDISAAMKAWGYRPKFLQAKQAFVIDRYASQAKMYVQRHKLNPQIAGVKVNPTTPVEEEWLRLRTLFDPFDGNFAGVSAS